MSLQRIAAVISAVVLAGWAVTASAAGDYGRSGPYVGAGANYAIDEFDVPPAVNSVDGSWGYDIKAGYRFNQYFALEGLWEQWLGFDYSPSKGFEGWMLSVNGKLFLSDYPIQPYLLSGIGLMHGNDDLRDVDKNNFGLRFCAGVDLYVTRNWAITAESGYVLPTGGLSNYGLVPISFGLMYRFY